MQCPIFAMKWLTAEHCWLLTQTPEHWQYYLSSISISLFLLWTVYLLTSKPERRQEGNKTWKTGTRKVIKKIQECRTGRDLSVALVIWYLKHTGCIIYLISSQSSISSVVSILPTLFQIKGWSKSSAFWQQRTPFLRQSLPTASYYYLFFCQHSL